MLLNSSGTTDSLGIILAIYTVSGHPMSCQVRSSIEQIQQIIPCDVQIIISDSKRAEQFETEAGMPVNRLRPVLLSRLQSHFKREDWIERRYGQK
tara:strand:- start:422 stop:706 length:285 start_codon:yes stop_codon:yes gene_type:complete